MRTTEKKDERRDTQGIQEMPVKKLSHSDRAIREICMAKGMAKTIREALQGTHIHICCDRRMRIPEIHGRFFIEDGMRSMEGVEIGVDLAEEGDTPAKRKTIGIIIYIGVPVHDCRSDQNFEVAYRGQFSWLKNHEPIIVRYRNREDMRQAVEKIRKLTKLGEGLMYFHQKNVLPMIDLPPKITLEQWRDQLYSVRSLGVLGGTIPSLFGVFSRANIVQRMMGALHMDAVRSVMQETQNILEKTLHMSVGTLDPAAEIIRMIEDGMIMGLAGALLMIIIGKTRLRIIKALEQREKKEHMAPEDI